MYVGNDSKQDQNDRYKPKQGQNGHAQGIATLKPIMYPLDQNNIEIYRLY